MTPSIRHRIATLLGASALTLLIAAVPGVANTAFTEAAPGFSGVVRIGPKDAPALQPGGTYTVNGRDMIPGQTVTLMRGATILNEGQTLTVDAEGKFTFEGTLDADAAPGMQPIAILAENPAAAKVVEVPVSKPLPIAGAELFDIAEAEVAASPYQVAITDDALLVTSAVGRPPIKESSLQKLNRETMATEAAVTPATAPAGKDGKETGLLAVYGIGVDPDNGHVWVTNTRQDTLAVYKLSDLSLVKQFEAGTVYHPRDVVIDAPRGRAYVSGYGTGEVRAFDLKTLEPATSVKFQTKSYDNAFFAMSLALDAASGTLLSPSMTTAELGVADLTTGETRVIALPGAINASGVAFDPKDKLAFVASQDTGNLLIVDTAEGKVLHDVAVGAGALNVAFEPVSRLVYVANRGAGTVAVVDTDGKLVANLDAGPLPNNLAADGKGNVYVLSKAAGPETKTANRILRLRLKD